MDATPSKKLKVTFIVHGTVEWEKLQKTLQGLTRADSIDKITNMWIEEVRPKGRPPVNKAAVLGLIAKSKKPVSNIQMSRKLNLDRRAVYASCRSLVEDGMIESVFDEKWKVKRWRLTTQA